MPAITLIHGSNLSAWYFTCCYKMLIFMDLIVRTDDSIRLESGSQGSVFADVNSNNCQLGIDVTFYEMHNLKLIEKNRTFKMFVIPKNYPIDEFDFGWWKDGKVVWQSI